MRFCILSSGSSGNSALVVTEGSRLLLDAGLSARKLDGDPVHCFYEPAIREERRVQIFCLKQRVCELFYGCEGERPGPYCFGAISA